MLRINSLELENFMNIPKAKFDFSDINYIYGDPASGKSALFEAIRVCLSDDKRSSTYGSYVMQGCDYAKIILNCDIDNQNAVFNTTLNRVAGTPFECVLTIGDDVYKNTKVKEFLKTKELDYYFKIMFSHQHEKDIIEQTPSSRLLYVQKLFNFDYSEQKKEITDALTENKSQSLELNAKFQTLNDSKKMFELVENPRDRKINNEERELLKEKISENEKLLEEEHKKYEQISLLKDEISEKTRQMQSLSFEKKNILMSENSKNVLNENILSLKERVESNSKMIKEMEDSLTSKKVMLSDLVKTKDKEKENYNSNNDKLSKLLVEKKILEGKVRLIEAGVCPECGQKTDHIDDSAIPKLEEINVSISTISEEKTTAYNKYTNTVDSIDDINKAIAKTEVTIISLQEKNKEFQNQIKNYEEKISSIDNNSADDSNNNIKDIDASLEALNNEILMLNNKLNGLGEINTKRFLDKINEYKKQISDDDNILLINNEIQKRNIERSENLIKVEKDIKQTSDAIIENTKTKEAYEEAWNIINKILPQYESKVYCDSIQSKINNFIKKVFPSYFVKMETKNKGCELNYTKNKLITDEKRNKWIDVQMSSGFERAVLNTAFKTTLAELYNIDLFIGDEIDKAANDKETIKLINSILEYENYHQIFIISHKKALYEYLTENYDGDELHVFKADSGIFTKEY